MFIFHSGCSILWIEGRKVRFALANSINIPTPYLPTIPTPQKCHLNLIMGVCGFTIFYCIVCVFLYGNKTVTLLSLSFYPISPFKKEFSVSHFGNVACMPQGCIYIFSVLQIEHYNMPCLSHDLVTPSLNLSLFGHIDFL